MSLCGGAPRDLLLNAKVNDYDLVIPDVDKLVNTEAYREVNSGGLLRVRKSSSEQHPHHIFYYTPTDPVEFHPIDDYSVVSDAPDSDIVITPGKFDFTINEIHMNDKGQFYASPKTWFDFDNRILRANLGRAITSNIAIRMLRLAAKDHLNIDINTAQCVAYKFAKGYVNECTVLNQLKKCVEDEVSDICFDWLKKLGYPQAKRYPNLDRLIEDMQGRVDLGYAVEKEPRHTAYEDGL
jgi:hypothetical protein